MNKLEQIKYLLEVNRNIIIFNINDIDRRNNPSLLMHTDLAHVVNFNVVPKKEFDIDNFLAQRMQSFMWILIPNLKPDKTNNFGRENITYTENGKEKQALILKMGYLDFYEDLEGGLIQTTLNFGNKRHEMSKEVNYLRKITINPFPSKEVAEKYQYSNFIGYIKLNLKTPILT